MGGKRGGKWPQQPSWQLWRGAKSPRDGAWRQDYQDYQDFSAWKSWPEDKAYFPRYDERRPPATGRGDPEPGQASQAGGFVQDFQNCLNHARKAEQRVKSLTRTREQKVALWADYMEQLRKNWLKECQRHEQNLQRLDDDIQEAYQQQEEARSKLCWVAARYDGKQGSEEATASGPDPWTEMCRQWKKEAQQDDGPEAILQRALQTRGQPKREVTETPQASRAPPGLNGGDPFTWPGGLKPPKTEARDAGRREAEAPSGRMPSPSPEPMAVSGGYNAPLEPVATNPYHASPSTRHTAMSPPTGRPPKSSSRPRQPVKTHTKPEINTGSRTFQDRMDEKRQQALDREISRAPSAEPEAVDGADADVHAGSAARPPGEEYLDYIPTIRIDDESEMD
ncbi:unnamed protein product [Symbiodinium sp. CCMP2592]|nr:unnamed protein product [Symbiodinium sp. CCMP2592]